MRIDQNKPKNLNPWINHWHSNHKASHFARCCLWIIIWNACIWRELQTGFFISRKNILISFESELVFLCLQMHPKMEIKSRELRSGMLTMTKKLFMEKFFLTTRMIADHLPSHCYSGLKWAWHVQISSSALSPLTRFNFPSNISQLFFMDKNIFIVVVEGRFVY